MEGQRVSILIHGLRSFSFSYVLGTHTHTHTHTHSLTHSLSHTHSGISYGPCRCQWVLGTCTRRPWLWALPPRSFRLIDAGHQLHRSRALDSADKLLLSLNNGCLHVVGGPGTWPRRRQRVLSSLTTLPPLFLLDYLHGVILTPVARTPCACMPWRRQRQRHRCSRKNKLSQRPLASRPGRTRSQCRTGRSTALRAASRLSAGCPARLVPSQMTARSHCGSCAQGRIRLRRPSCQSVLAGWGRALTRSASDGFSLSWGSRQTKTVRAHPTNRGSRNRPNRTPSTRFNGSKQGSNKRRISKSILRLVAREVRLLVQNPFG